MIKRVRIKGYKSLNDFEADLSPLTVIFGPNASGKSNFLDALQLFSRMANLKTLKDAFDPPYRGRPVESFTYSENGIEGLLRKERVSFSFSVDIELSDSLISQINKEINDMRKGLDPKNGKIKIIPAVKEKFLRYDLEVEFLPSQGFLRVFNESVTALKPDLTENKKRKPFLEKNENRLSLRMEGQAHPVFHDIGLDHTVLSLPLYPPHYPHITALKAELDNWRFFYLEPRERMRAANPSKEITKLGMMGDDLAAFLNTIKHKEPEQKRFKAIERALHSIIPAIDRIDTEINSKTGEVELIVYENNVPISSRLISEGTLRLIGLLSIGAAEQGPYVICFEEPENGIHPRRIKLIAEYLKSVADEYSQIIVTTHSPILPDLLAVDSLYVCKKEHGRTTIKPFKETKPLFKQMDIQAALDEDEIIPFINVSMAWERVRIGAQP